MISPTDALIPLVHRGVLHLRDGWSLSELESDHAMVGHPIDGVDGLHLIDPVPEGDFNLSLAGPEGATMSFDVQVGGWSGRVDWVKGGMIGGIARNLRIPSRDQIIVAFTSDGVVASARAIAAAGGQFTLMLPPEIIFSDERVAIRIGPAGSDYLLEGGRLDFGCSTGLVTPVIAVRPARDFAIRLKISAPDLKEAPLWGDFHFANALAASFGRIGVQADVDTVDAWYAHGAHEDVVINIRGRHRLKTDPSKINIMWLISHPDRVTEEEYDDYDHIAVASDMFATSLQQRGLPNVSVLHQATDHTHFNTNTEDERIQRCLFVGSSRREYRRMIRWCIEQDVPLDLYGGGWDGIIPADLLRATSISNADLPGFYARHLLLLNDHWDSMRSNGFLSNRLFDGSATATPILSDDVVGLSEVFGDTIATAETSEDFAQHVQNCMDDPDTWLERAERARQIVYAAHTFDHRAQQLFTLIDRVSARRRTLV